MDLIQNIVFWAFSVSPFQVLDELNLTVEAMLMPDELSMSTAEELLSSPATSSLDSGFSSSSTGTNSLGRPPTSSRKKTPHAFWKKLPGLGPSHATVKPSGKETIKRISSQFSVLKKKAEGASHTARCFLNALFSCRFLLKLLDTVGSLADKGSNQGWPGLASFKRKSLW